MCRHTLLLQLENSFPFLLSKALMFSHGYIKVMLSGRCCWRGQKQHGFALQLEQNNLSRFCSGRLPCHSNIPLIVFQARCISF